MELGKFEFCCLASLCLIYIIWYIFYFGMWTYVEANLHINQTYSKYDKRVPSVDVFRYHTIIVAFVIVLFIFLIKRL